MDAKRTVKFESELDADLLDAVRALARQQGRQVASLVDEALAEFIARKRAELPREDVMALHEESIKKYENVYKKLAE